MGEGFRNFDLMRLMEIIPAKGIARAKALSESGNIWPVSAVELSLNKLIKDN